MGNGLNGLEKIVGKVIEKSGKALKSLGMAGALLGSMYLGDKLAGDVSGQVRFYIEPENALGAPLRQFIPGTDLIIKVYVDNTNETNATQGLQWSIQAPEYIKYFSQVSPKPYYETDDFFYGFPMDPLHNKVGNNINDRFVVVDTNNISINSGPYKKSGLVGRYRYNIEEGASLGQKTFTFTETKAFDVNGKKQNTITEKSSIIVTDNYEYLDKNPIVFFDIDNGLIRVYETAVSNGRRTLQRSENLIDWVDVLTNSAPYDGLSYREKISGNPNVFFKGIGYPTD
ncbi:hypothetical protein HYW75_01480 [Candidatus Pacearchaeota archaeon]|nr:hypothetical protein [Candidatus Pacearchaeota archaeon]